MTTDRDDLIALDKFRRSGPKYKFSQAECELLDRVLERLRAQPTPGGWRPISEAPKDGRRILLWWPYWSKTPTIGYWKHTQWIAENALVDDSPGPEAWQPLPPAPATEQTQEK